MWSSGRVPVQRSNLATTWPSILSSIGQDIIGWIDYALGDDIVVFCRLSARSAVRCLNLVVGALHQNLRCTLQILTTINSGG